MRDLTNYDYQSLKRRITDLLKDKDGWGDGYDSSFGQTLIQLMADTTDYLHYMLERRTQESFITTARLQSSVNARASEVGYRIRRAVSSRGTLTLTLVDENNDPVMPAGNVVIPRFKKITFDGENFLATEEVTITPAMTSVDIPVMEGEFIEEVFDPNELETVFNLYNYILLTDYANIENSEIFVTEGIQAYYDVLSSVAGNPPIGALSFAAGDDYAFDLKYGNEGLRIVFGDDTFGKKPVNPVTIGYVKTKGPEVSIQATGLEFSFEENELADDVVIVPQNTYAYTLTNSTPIVGGLAIETIDSVKNNSPAFIRTNNRAVVPEDYAFWVLQSGIGDIKDIVCYGEEELGNLFYTMNNVYLTYLKGDGDDILTTGEEQAIRDYMRSYKKVTSHLVLTPAKTVSVRYRITHKRDKQLPISDAELYTIVRKNIEDYFAIGPESIGSEYQHSELVDILQSITVERNGIVYPATDFVKVTLDGLYDFSILSDVVETNIVKVKLNSSGVNGDTLEITVDGTPFTVTSASDTPETLMYKMKDELFAGTNLKVEATGDTLKISTFDGIGEFNLNVSGGTLAAQTETTYVVKLPASVLTNPFGDQLFEPGTFSIINSDGETFYSEDGDGVLTWVHPSTPSFVPNTGQVDFVTGEVEIPLLDDGTYFIQFNQDEFQNFKANERTAVLSFPSLATVPEFVTDETLSYIRLIR